jgi:hypothetical protein
VKKTTFLTYLYVEKLYIPYTTQYQKYYIGPELLHPGGGNPVEEAQSASLPPLPYGLANQAGLPRPK